MEKRYEVIIKVVVVANTEKGAINEALYRIEKTNDFEVEVEVLEELEEELDEE
jgi:hypothetical protein